MEMTVLRTDCMKEETKTERWLRNDTSRNVILLFRLHVPLARSTLQRRRRSSITGVARLPQHGGQWPLVPIFSLWTHGGAQSWTWPTHPGIGLSGQ